ncbi:MAG: formyltransferase family protein [Cyanobacteria bacterium J06648_16]
MKSFKIGVISDSDSWINAYIPGFLEKLTQLGHDTYHAHTIDDIREGDFLFILGCGKVIPKDTLLRNRHNLVVHESALPEGRGWSPLTWQILAGQNAIPITLFEAANDIDSGVIYLQSELTFKGTELVAELRETQAEVCVNLCLEFVRTYPDILSEARAQAGQPSYYRRRYPKDSQLDPEKSIVAQFDLLRVVDNERYPAFFEFRGETYYLKIQKKGDATSLEQDADG